MEPCLAHPASPGRERVPAFSPGWMWMLELIYSSVFWAAL